MKYENFKLINARLKNVKLNKIKIYKLSRMLSNIRNWDMFNFKKNVLFKK